MIIVDKPYVSEFLKRTILENQIPLLKTSVINEFKIAGNYNFINEYNAIELLNKKPDTKIYSNSENAINWILKNLAFTEIPSKIGMFKDKVRFRELIKGLFSDFYFRSVLIEEFDEIKIQDIPKPFIIKPSIGFFSMAVYKVSSDDEWTMVKTKIKEEIKQIKGIYPTEVMDTGKFIIEQVIEGEEYAIDAYYNEKGEAVVLNIMHHVFSSDQDFSDRLYITSGKIIREKVVDFEGFLNQMGNLAGLRNFPVHVEVRVDKSGKIIPIEVNPLRFGAWCTTADVTWFAYGYNSIATYFAGEKPDWDKLLAKKQGKIYSMMVLENSTGFSADQIKLFNYTKLLYEFENPIEIREIDYHHYPVFGFMFAETREDNISELEKLLKSNLTEYIELL